MVSDHTDPERIEAAARHFADFMRAIGHDPDNSLHLAGTPLRVAKMYAELLHGQPFTFTTFPAEGDQMIVMRDVPFVSFCAHHFLPFTGKAHIGYIPNAAIAGLSKLARTVQHFAAAPQVQEGLTEDVASALDANLRPAGVAVVIEARHECMEIRGARSVGAITTTSALRGVFTEDSEARAEFLSFIRR